MPYLTTEPFTEISELLDALGRTNIISALFPTGSRFSVRMNETIQAEIFSRSLKRLSSCLYHGLGLELDSVEPSLIWHANTSLYDNFIPFEVLYKIKFAVILSKLPHINTDFLLSLFWSITATYSVIIPGYHGSKEGAECCRYVVHRCHQPPSHNEKLTAYIPGREYKEQSLYQTTSINYGYILATRFFSNHLLRLDFPMPKL